MTNFCLRHYISEKIIWIPLPDGCPEWFVQFPRLVKNCPKATDTTDVKKFLFIHWERRRTKLERQKLTCSFDPFLKNDRRVEKRGRNTFPSNFGTVIVWKRHKWKGLKSFPMKLSQIETDGGVLTAPKLISSSSARAKWWNTACIKRARNTSLEISNY